MSEFGEMNVADSLKGSWVDSEGRPLKNLKAADLVLIDRINNLEKDVTLIRNSLISLHEKVLNGANNVKIEPTIIPEKKTKKAKK